MGVPLPTPPGTLKHCCSRFRTSSRENAWTPRRFLFLPKSTMHKRNIADLAPESTKTSPSPTSKHKRRLAVNLHSQLPAMCHPPDQSSLNCTSKRHRTTTMTKGSFKATGQTHPARRTKSAPTRRPRDIFTLKKRVCLKFTNDRPYRWCRLLNCEDCRKVMDMPIGSLPMIHATQPTHSIDY